MVADSKKRATIRNLWYTRVARPILNADAVVADIRAAIVANGLAGIIPEAERNAMLAVESALQSLAALPGVTQAEGKYILHHSTEQDQVGLEI